MAKSSTKEKRVAVVEKKLPERDEWYVNLLEECRAALVETRFAASFELIRGKWEIGRIVSQSKKDAERFGWGEQIIKKLAEDLGISGVHLYKMVQFYEKYPVTNFEEVVEAIPMLKNTTWFQLTQKVLPKVSEEQQFERDKKDIQRRCSHPRYRCLNCGKKFTLEELIKRICPKERKFSGETGIDV